MFDVIIIGKGPAGISTALYTQRANLSTLVIGKDGGALEKTEKTSLRKRIKKLSYKYF